jgi:uncharacterized membrane protein (UPF0127 family)
MASPALLDHTLGDPTRADRRRALRVLCGAGGIAASWIANPLGLADPLRTWPLRIRGHEIVVELADSPESRRTGLMHRRSLDESRGMLFTYDQPGLHAMWMRNTHVPLSVAFIDAGGRVINIEDMEPLTETPHAAAAPASFSLEVNRGWFRKRGIRPGDRVEGLQALPGVR